MDTKRSSTQKLFPYRIGFHTAESHQFRVPNRPDTIGAFKLDFEGLGAKPAQLALGSGSWGEDLKREIQDTFGHQAEIAIFLEQLPDEKNSITLDPHVKDCFGDPVPRVTYALGQYERATLNKAAAKAEEILDALGATQIGSDLPDISFCGHHIGTCRMGENPEKSVVNRDLRAHDIKNLFIVGSSVFVTGAAVNPSLTIAALALRAAETIVAEGAS